jgi:ELWxxDGT repeat protein
VLSLLVALTLSGQPVLLYDEPGAATDSETFLEVDTGDDPNVLVVENDFWGTELFSVSADNQRSLIVDLCPGTCGSYPEQLTRIGKRLVFLATDRGEAFPNQLWVTDGSVVGTIKLADDIDNTQTLVARLVPVGEQVLFMKGGDIWVSDGTKAGTALAPWGSRRQLVGAAVTTDHRFIEVNDLPVDHCQLLVTGVDVRTATALPMPNPAEHCGEPVVTLGERAVISLTSGLWRFGATGVPVQLDSAPGTRLTQVQTTLFFFRIDAMSVSLLVTAGEPNTTLPLSTVMTPKGIQHVGISGNRLIYSAADAAGVHHLYGSDGTVAGTGQAATLLGPTFGIMTVGPEAFVADGIPDGPSELLETDGSTSGTSVLQGIYPFNFADRLGYRGARGHSSALNLIALVVNELGAFRIRPGEQPESVFLKPANPISSSPQAPLLHGGEAFFTAGAFGPAIFRTDGTPDGSTRFADGGLLGFAENRALVLDDGALGSISLTTGERQFLDAGSLAAQAVQLKTTTVLATGDKPRMLWRTDGTAGGTVRLADLGDVVNPGSALALPGGTAVFPGAQSLWLTDGTEAGTKQVPVPGASALLVELPAADGAWVVWTASDRTTTLSHVTGAGVRNLKTWPAGTLPALLSSNGDQLAAVVTGGPALELWTASPAEATHQPGPGLRSVRALAWYGGKLLVLGDQQLLELGAGGALTAIAPAPGATFLHVEAGRLFSDPASPDLGGELAWYDDRLHLFLPTGDLSTGVGSSSPSTPLLLGKRFVFSAWSPDTGREPWSWEPDLPSARGCGCDAGGGSAILAMWAMVLARRRRVSS